jgi:hypothetical protein
MASFRPLLLALVTVVACGSDSGTIVPQGMHYHYVSNQVNVPTNNTQARAYGLDLNGDGTVDNQLGMVLGTLSSMGFDIQGNIDTSVAEGGISVLIDFQTKDFNSTAAAGIQAFLGTNPSPAACNGSADKYTCTGSGSSATCTGCGHQLAGTAMFDLQAGGPTNASLAGKIVSGTFTGGPGDLALQIAIGGQNPIELDLIGARAKASMISDTAMGATTGTHPHQMSVGGVNLGGAITQDDLNNKIIPQIQMQLGPIIVRDCCGTGNTAHPTCDPAGNPPCGCADGSTGKTILGLFDTTPKDCAVSVTEIQTNSLIMSLLAPDVTINGKMALSLGVNVTAVGATFSPPGE